jgi:hypothetical protein
MSASISDTAKTAPVDGKLRSAPPASSNRTPSEFQALGGQTSSSYRDSNFCAVMQ